MRVDAGDLVCAPRCAKCERPDSSARYHGLRCLNHHHGGSGRQGAAATSTVVQSEVARLRSEAAAAAAELDRARQTIANLRLEKER